jgi:hypothetical protein
MASKDVIETLDAIDNLTLKLDVDKLSQVVTIIESLGTCYRVIPPYYTKVQKGTLSMIYDDEEYDYMFIFTIEDEQYGDTVAEYMLTSEQVLNTVFKTEKEVKEFQRLINANT